MFRRSIPAVAGGILGLALWLGGPTPAEGQPPPPAPEAPPPAPAPDVPPAGYAPAPPPPGLVPPLAPGQPTQSLQRFFYYPYYYFPHNYWPTMGPRWPEPIGAPCMVPPPAYMAYPPFREPNWHYPLWETATWYKGFHFWLDQF